ncbi:MAG TPA: serine/threonine-protein kinase [Fibrobacteria bacterium]|nr:serine/threonine-protein kinase [Fibrobacteria bacterium]
MLLTGKVLGHCHIESLIGEGSSAQVYKGMHQTLGIPVAVKILKVAPHDSMASHLATYRDRFRREAQLAARLNHEGIVRVLDFGEEMGSLYLVMEYVNGYTLSEYLRNNGPMGEEIALRVIAFLAAALHAAHAQNIVHRDVKPGNILITKDGWLKISDLGLAKDLSARDMTNADTLLGTPYYMAPECFIPGKDLGPAADLYSLGVILYQMLTGSPPYTGTLNQVISGHLHSEPAYAASVNGVKTPLPEPTVRLLKALLAKEPAMRPKTGREVADLCQIRLQAVQAGAAYAKGADHGRDYSSLADSSTFQRLGHFMEKNLGSRTSEYQGRHVMHTTGVERLLIWALAIIFLVGCLLAYFSSR